MKIEYLKDGSADCPLIRIYGNEPDSIRLLMENIAFLINGNVKRLQINDIDGFYAINQCQLEMQVAPASKGVIHIKDNSFQCLLSLEDWETVYELLEPLSKNAGSGYQWLDETSEISLLVSRYENGQW